MKVKVSETNNIVRSGNSSGHHQGVFEVEPYRIRRSPCGYDRYNKPIRYNYDAIFTGVKGMLDIDGQSLEGKEVRSWIRRKHNKHFNPKKFDFVDNVAAVNQTDD